MAPDADETMSWKDRVLAGEFSEGVIGHRRQEWAILPEDEQFVLGAAAGEPGAVRIERPAGDGAEYIITTQSEAQLVAERRGAMRPYVVGSAAAALFGVFFLGVA